jgi:hypothetical protein
VRRSLSCTTDLFVPRPRFRSIASIWVIKPPNLSTSLRAGHDHIRIVAPATRTDEPCRPIENGGLGVESLRHLAGLGLHLKAAFSAHTIDRTGTAAASRASSAGRNSCPSPSPVSSCSRWLVTFQGRQRLGFCLGPDLGEDAFPHLPRGDAGNGRRRLSRGAAERVRRFPHGLGRVHNPIDEAVNQCWRVHTLGN